MFAPFIFSFSVVLWSCDSGFGKDNNVLNFRCKECFYGDQGSNRI